MLSNLRSTTRECVHVVMRGHFRPRDKDGGDTTRCAVCHMQASWLCVSLLPTEVSHCAIFYVFDSCDLDLNRISSYTNWTRIRSRYTRYAIMKFLCQGFPKLPSDRQTDHGRNYIRRLMAGDQ